MINGYLKICALIMLPFFTRAQRVTEGEGSEFVIQLPTQA